MLKMRSSLEKRACAQHTLQQTLSPPASATYSSPLCKTLPTTQEDFSKQVTEPYKLNTRFHFVFRPLCNPLSGKRFGEISVCVWLLSAEEAPDGEGTEGGQRGPERNTGETPVPGGGERPSSPGSLLSQRGQNLHEELDLASTLPKTLFFTFLFPKRGSASSILGPLVNENHKVSQLL